MVDRLFHLRMAAAATVAGNKRLAREAKVVADRTTYDPTVSLDRRPSLQGIAKHYGANTPNELEAAFLAVLATSR